MNNILITLCALAISASARVVGPSGIVRDDGTNVQFTIEQAEKFNRDGSLPKVDNMKFHIPEGSIVGESGIVYPDGTQIQFTLEQAQKFLEDQSLPQLSVAVIEIPEDSIVGASGIVSPNGNTQFTLEQAQNFVQESSKTQEIHNIVVPVTPTFTAPAPAPIPAAVPAHPERLVGPSGIVTPNGNIQFTHEQVINGNIETTMPIISINVPASTQGSQIRFQQGDQIIILDGFTQEQVDNFEYVGPSGIITKDGQNIQLRSRRSAEFSSLVGPSGIVGVNGNTQFTIEQAEKFNQDGSLPQADTLKLNIPEGSIVGESGIIYPDGTQIQFTLEQAQKFLEDRSLPQFTIEQANTMEFNIPEGSIVGESGIVYPDGTQIQFTLEQAQEFIEDGSLEQFKAMDIVIPEESIVGASGIVSPDGTLTQFTLEQAAKFIEDGSLPQLTVPAPAPIAAPIPAPAQADTLKLNIPEGSIVGESGIIYPDGTQIQFTLEQAQKFLEDRSLPQFTIEQANTMKFNIPEGSIVGESGIVYPDGTQIQFTLEQAAKFIEDGSLPQLTVPAPAPIAATIPAPAQADTLKLNIPEGSIVGESGIIYPDGTQIQFTLEQAQKFLEDRSLPQFTIEQANTMKFNIPEGSIVGESGIVYPDGTQIQFTLEQAAKFIEDGSLPQLTVPAPAPIAASIPAPANPERLVGPSGIVDPSGNIQFSLEQVDNNQANLNVVSPVTSTFNLLPPVLAPFVVPSINHNQEISIIAKGSQIEFKQGDNIVILEGFTREQVDNFAYIGPSGIVTKDGMNIQLV